MGRPREFDVERALDAAMRVFWTKGYEGTTLTDLTDATGVSRPSLYSAFGNKEALFKKALDRYAREKLAFIDRAIEAPTAREVAEDLLHGMLDRLADERDPKGCMGVINSVACGDEAEPIRADILARTLAIKAALIARFERAREEGDLPEQVEPAAITTYLMAILQGMALQSGNGAPTEELGSLVTSSLALWPKA
ncbi:TetR/AcrR family transcriptional regulator [Sphingomonas sp. HF-S4]|uniref:TetR/AcrR family transcriptional regulator n=2 Tax=Sphingomonas agrestis TaxID=3080540 RepID=A0ABU3Y4P8_9SPHN|nr:TetR/AcrR family transcriptional regulator [Sphingomonas sp. HF-S4]MDV3456072.1 TetR/AcrR family transcriptional regulator [Sphingomonas sp. HF-S4]